MGLTSTFFLGNLNTYYSSVLSYLLDYFSWLEVRIKRVIYQNIKILFDNNSYKGIRHKDSLPVRGQRTRTNACTKKRYKIVLNED
jgi:small subunit ribosomal protein S13